MSRRIPWVPIVLLGWLGAAIALGASGTMENARAPFPQLIILVLTAAVTVAIFAVPTVRAWAFSVDVRTLVALHLTRFVGIYFLVLHARGELPRAFAVPAGWGDIGVAVLAAILLVNGPPTTRARRNAYRLWNLIGLIDILLVVATAARLGVANPASMRALLRAPLNLLLTYLVPLIIASHLLLAERLSPRAAIAPA